jgi:hypothetical protein
MGAFKTRKALGATARLAAMREALLRLFGATVPQQSRINNGLRIPEFSCVAQWVRAPF